MPAVLLLICNGSQLSIQNLNAATFSRKTSQWSRLVNSQYKSHSRATSAIPNVFKFEIQDTELPIYMNIYVLSLTFIGPKRLFYEF